MSIIKGYAEKHYNIIEKFGRFPHRNQVLQRESTEEEIEYLKSAQTFGQWKFLFKKNLNEKLFIMISIHIRSKVIVSDRNL